MRFTPQIHKKPFFDLTKEDDRDRIEELEKEVYHLNDIVTSILLKRGKQCAA